MHCDTFTIERLQITPQKKTQTVFSIFGFNQRVLVFFVTQGFDSMPQGPEVIS